MFYGKRQQSLSILKNISCNSGLTSKSIKNMKSKILSLVCVSLALVSCKKAEDSSADYESKAAVEMADSTAVNSNWSEKTANNNKAEAVISSSAAKEDGKSGRAFVRTADVKFRAKTVASVTYQIEDITSKMGGFVTNTQLSSNIDYKNTTRISADSTLESTYYTVNNTMVIRVPNVKLDTTLKQIAKLIEYLDYRNISASDVTLQLLGNTLTQKRIQQHEEKLRTAIDNRGKKLNETVYAEENVLDRQQQADAAAIENKSLKDQVDFSTINLTIYQNQSVQHALVANEKNIKGYEPSFWFKLWDSLSYGFGLLQDFILFIAKIWWIVGGAITIFFIARYYNAKMKK
jgi:hypothetical protein